MTRSLRPRQRATPRSPAAPYAPSTALPLAADILAVFNWQLLPSPTLSVRPPTTTASGSVSDHASPAPQTVVTCALCSRRVGLWTFTATRPLDVVASHAASCPSLSITVADRLQALAEPESMPQPNRRQVRNLVDALLGPKVTLDEVRRWKVEVDQLEGSALGAHTPTQAVRPGAEP